VVRAFANDPEVSPPEPQATSRRKFGSNGLKVRGKIFAMLSRDQLVVKLPEQRVTALVDSGDGQRMVSGGAREMKEWLVLDEGSQQDWLVLAREACNFARSGSK
jgi:TfoX/Sxy family transcriptional regulator of competence genes